MPIEAGTRLTIAPAGFALPGGQAAYDAMSPGWRQVMRRLDRVVEQEAGS
jgi:hypothetical protein